MVEGLESRTEQQVAHSQAYFGVDRGDDDDFGVDGYACPAFCSKTIVNVGLQNLMKIV